MTIEEKAKAYDKALEIAKKNYDVAQDLCNGSQIGVECFKNTLTNIFPELGESKDEKIRKALIALLKFGLEDGSAVAPGFNETKEQALAWLEKQGEQKPVVIDFKASDWYVSKVDGQIHDMTYNPTDMVEPKFKVGDWIVKENIVYHIDKISGVYLTLSTLNGTALVYHTNVLDNDKIHLWTIQDAKDGDVLVDKYGNIGIYQGDKNAVRWNSYCYCGVNKEFYEEGSHEFPCYPATKEQRELLFQKMKEAGMEEELKEKGLVHNTSTL